MGHESYVVFVPRDVSIVVLLIVRRRREFNFKGKYQTCNLVGSWYIVKLIYNFLLKTNLKRFFITYYPRFFDQSRITFYL